MLTTIPFDDLRHRAWSSSVVRGVRPNDGAPTGHEYCLVLGPFPRTLPPCLASSSARNMSFRPTDNPGVRRLSQCVTAALPRGIRVVFVPSGFCIVRNASNQWDMPNVSCPAEHKLRHNHIVLPWQIQFSSGGTRENTAPLYPYPYRDDVSGCLRNLSANPSDGYRTRPSAPRLVSHRRPTAGRPEGPGPAVP
jgi:hypothetical protein